MLFPSQSMQKGVQLKKNAMQKTARYARKKYLEQSVKSTAAIRISVILLPSKWSTLFSWFCARFWLQCWCNKELVNKSCRVNFFCLTDCWLTGFSFRLPASTRDRLILVWCSLIHVCGRLSLRSDAFSHILQMDRHAIGLNSILVFSVVLIFWTRSYGSWQEVLIYSWHFDWNLNKVTIITCTEFSVACNKYALCFQEIKLGIKAFN